MSNKIEIYSRDYLVPSTDEEGYPSSETRFEIIAEFSNGRRFRHNNSFDNIDAANELSDKIQASVNNGVILNRDYWNEVEPAYGSQYYQSSNAESAALAREIAIDKDDLAP